MVAIVGWLLGFLLSSRHLRKKYNKYEVSGVAEHISFVMTKSGKKWNVDLQKMTYSCCKWQITGIPCVYIVVVIRKRKDKWIQHMMDIYVMPIENVEDWKVPDKMVFPLPFESNVGRPKKHRIRVEDEPQAKGPMKKCSKCGAIGHNSRTCKDNMPPKPKRTGISEDCQGEQHDAAPRRTKEGKKSGGETSQQFGANMAMGETTQQSGTNVSMGETSQQPRVPLVIPAPPPLRETSSCWEDTIAFSKDDISFVLEDALAVVGSLNEVKK
ncbi:hypothetical protein IFM89_031118 [Coptis chinensis]|uniref:CCHC-type domain-containing protein n=1 Tax=Coptis chinensis TaxID=261450 RepID=A0A835M7N6_9MAGN|nr:hypothetical protein IFM89_031118 [Coptis chinensis]